MKILDFPNEILLKIFKQNVLSVRDLSNLMLSSRRMYEVIQHSNEVWKQKFSSRWPGLVNIVKTCGNLSWQDIVFIRLKTSLSVGNSLKRLSPQCYADIEPSVDLMDKIIIPDQSIPLTTDVYASFVEDDLINIIFYQHQEQYLTLRYYARKVLRYLRMKKLDEYWKKFLSQPANQTSLLEGAVLISQWGQMDQEKLPSLESVKNLIDGIVQRVKLKLMESQPFIKFIPASHVENDMPDSQYGRKVLACINEVLYTELGFHGNVQNYHSFENSYIDQVLLHKKGIPITLCIVYHEVAKSLGVICEPVSFPQHFLLRWKEFPNKAEPNQYTYIDAFNTGSLHVQSSCPALIGHPRHNIPPEAYSAALPTQVFQRMVNNLIQSSRILLNNGRGDNSGIFTQLHFTRLACAVFRRQPHLTVGYAELCIFLGTQLEEAIHLLQFGDFHDPPEEESAPGHWSRIRQITTMKCENKLSYQKAQLVKRQRSLRPPGLKYAVGLIMHHVRYGYSCVIVYWDPICQATDEWIERMGVRNLERGKNQPFYHILVDDGSYRYAAEENLELSVESKTINHPDIGIHFDRYDGHRYISNAEKTAHFPEDEEAAQSLLLQSRLTTR